MSITLLKFAKSFLKGRLSAEIFSEAYMELWKIERDTIEGDITLLLKDTPPLSECLSSIFCASDMYCGDDKSRMKYELDSEQLAEEVAKLIEIYKQDSSNKNPKVLKLPEQ